MRHNLSHTQSKFIPMEERLFRFSERVVCIDSSGEFNNNKPLDLIEGKAYTVNSPYGEGVTLIGHGSNRYAQSRFIPQWVDFDLDDEIRDALNRGLLI